MIEEATFLFDKSVHNFERDFGVRVPRNTFESVINLSLSVGQEM